MTITTTNERFCRECNGTGADMSDFTGRCWMCSGHGLVLDQSWDWVDEEDHYTEDDCRSA